MQSISRRSAIGTTIAFFSELLFAQKALAATGQSITISVDGHPYTGQASINYGGPNYAYCTVVCTSGTGSNNICSVARLYNYNGALVDSKDNYGQHNVTAIAAGSVSGEYYGNGTMRVYRPEYGTWTSTTVPSTPHGYSRMAGGVLFETNEAGETCGAAPLAEEAGIQLDLILAIGISGVEGYIKSDDYWTPLPTSESEIEEYMSIERVRTIPVYAFDGMTVVDFFDLHYGGSN